MKWQLDGRAQNIEAVTERGTVLDGVLFANTDGEADTVVIAITGIHGNFYSNPFYFNFGDTLNAGGIHFVYAQVCDAFGEIRTRNAHTDKEEVIGSWNERFSYAAEDIRAYIDWAEGAGPASTSKPSATSTLSRSSSKSSSMQAATISSWGSS